jgi:protein-disulfide isomerase
MAKKKTSLCRVPDKSYKRIAKMGKNFGVSNTKGFIIQDKILFGDFKAKKMRSHKKNKLKYLVEFDI